MRRLEDAAKYSESKIFHGNCVQRSVLEALIVDKSVSNADALQGPWRPEIWR